MSIVIDLQTGQPKLEVTPWKQFEGTIAAGQSVTVDSIALAEFSRLDYKLSFYNNAETQNKNMSLSVQKQGTAVSDQVSNRSGALSLSVDSSVVSSEYHLVVTNSEAFVINYCLTVLTS